ncbi:MAG: LysM domain-containing protein, partial [Tepidanaerobacteraceae bacterium]
MVNRAKVLMSLIAMAVMFCMLPGISYAANYHVVQPKETLWGISRLYGLTVDELFRLNNLQSDLIHPGQRLLVSKDEAEGENFDESHAATEEAAEEEKDLATQIIDFAKTFIGTPYKSA